MTWFPLPPFWLKLPPVCVIVTRYCVPLAARLDEALEMRAE